jgi:hypothetical protein
VTTLSDAYRLARGRRVLPSALSSAEQRVAFSAAVRSRAVFSARTTSLAYLDIQRRALEDLLRGEVETVDKDGQPWTQSIGQAETRLRLKQALAALHYDPEAGHFGTAADAEIPPAERGSLQDLSSDRRLDLIIDVQRQRWQSAGQLERGMVPAVLAAFPAWELTGSSAMEPRQNWPARWMAAGGVLYGPGENRMIAAKTSRVWQRLGDLEDFADGIDGGLPPFAFGSKRGWLAVSRAECVAMGVELADAPAKASGKPPASPMQEPGTSAAERLPALVATVPAGVSEAGLAALRAAVGGKLAGKRLTFEERLAKSLAPAMAKAAEEAAK